MADCSKTVGLARSRLNYRCHVCAFFHSREDEYKILIPFMRESLDAGDRAVQIGPTCHDRCVTRDCDGRRTAGMASPEFGRTWDGRLEISLACMTSSSTSRGSTMSYRNMTLLQSAPMT